MLICNEEHATQKILFFFNCSNFQKTVINIDSNGMFRSNKTDRDFKVKIQKSIMVYKSLNGLVPEYLSSKFVKRNETRYSLRDSVNKLFVPFPRTNFMKNSFTYSGAVLWNSLPCHVREAESLSQFKRLVNVHF